MSEGKQVPVVYITTYFNQYPDDGYEIGNVYTNREEAEKAAQEQSDIDYGWGNYSIIERELKRMTDE